jgi:hypothetical protein
MIIPHFSNPRHVRKSITKLQNIFNHHVIGVCFKTLRVQSHRVVTDLRTDRFSDVQRIRHWNRRLEALKRHNEVISSFFSKQYPPRCKETSMAMSVSHINLKT